MNFEQARAEAQRQYDNQLPKEVEPEMDLDDYIEKLYVERHDKYALELGMELLSIIGKGMEHDYNATTQRKKEKEQYSSMSMQFSDLEDRERKYRHYLHDAIDGLVKILSEEQKEQALNKAKELI